MQEQVPPQVPNDPPIGNAMLEEFTASMTLLAQDLTAQDNRCEVDTANPIGEMSATRVREFLRMNPPEFHDSKVEKDPNWFIDKVYKVLAIMGVCSNNKAELAAYQSKDSTPIGAGSIEWETFRSALLDWFFPRELRENKLGEFINSSKVI